MVEIGKLRLNSPPVSARVDIGMLASTLARLVASGAALSKADLTRQTGLSRTTVETGMRALRGAGLIRTAGVRVSPGRGRPAEIWELDGDFGVVLIADCTAHSARLACFDLSQHQVASVRIRIDYQEGAQAVLGQLIEGFRALLRGVSAHPAVIVVGVPGPVDNRIGTVVRPPIMPGWDSFPVSDHLTDALGCPVLLENDVNLRALGEARAGRPLDGPLLYVKAGAGIGGGIVGVDGNLMHGADGAAGDIGHMTVSNLRVPCVCRKIGCLEAVASAAAVVRRLDGADPLSCVTEEQLVELRARLGAREPAALRQLNDSAEAIGEVVANLVQVLNPSRIVVGGLLAAGDELLAWVRAIVYQRALPLATRELAVTGPTLGDESGVAGGLITGIEYLLDASALRDQFALSRPLASVSRVTA